MVLAAPFLRNNGGEKIEDQKEKKII